jgi:hypothetical protein
MISEYVLNPDTKRYIKKGGKTFQKILKKYGGNPIGLETSLTQTPIKTHTQTPINKSSSNPYLSH